VSISLTPDGPFIAQGTNVQLIATGNYSDGSQADLTMQVAWGSNDPSVIVNADGLAHGVKPGAGTITATASGGPSGSTTVSVSSFVVQSVDVAPTSASIPAGTTEQFQAIGTWSDGLTVQDLTATVSWSSSDPTVAVVSNSPLMQGLATAESPGQATITGTFGQLAGSSDLTVTVATGVGPAGTASLGLAPPRPNPASRPILWSFVLTRPGPARLAIYDVRGTRVRSLGEGEFPAGSTSLSWNLADDRGQAVAPGLYWALLTAEGRTLRQHVIVLR
jgi:hypothetical protein